MSVIEASDLQYDSIGPEQLFLGLCRAACLSEKEIQEYAQHLGIVGSGFKRLGFEFGQMASTFAESSLDAKKLRLSFKKHIGPGNATGSNRELHRNEQGREVFRIADRLARGSGSFRILPVHLLWAIIVENKSQAYSFLCKQSIDVHQLAMMCEKKSQETFVEAQAAKEEKRNKAKTKTPFLDKFGRDLTARAEAGEIGQVVGRDMEIAAVCRGLVRKDKNAVVLLGEAGVGKTSIVDGLALAIVKKSLPEPLRSRFSGMRIIEISMSSLLAGTQFRGQFEERIQRMLDEARENRDSVIVFIDEMHLMMGAGAGTTGGMDAANQLKPALSRGEINFIGATTESEYSQHIEKDAAMHRRFLQIYVNEPTAGQTVQIMKELRGGLEKHYELTISDEAIQAAVEFTMRYMPSLRLPAKALDVLHQSCANVLCGGEDQAFWTDPTASKPSRKTLCLGREDVAHVISGQTKIPVSRLLAKPEGRIEDIRRQLSERIIGQEEAVEAVCDTILRAQQGLTRPNRPDGVFLLVGPTGVGKTELAKAVADVLFDGDSSHFVVFDMSEYEERHKIAQLTGAAPGYIGYEHGGVLTEALRRQPFCVLLFDEVEKAHPDISTIFLQIFEEGRLTDNHGRRADFQHTIIFLTSNLGSADPKTAGLTSDWTRRHENAELERRKREMEAVKSYFRPELLNRIDRIIHFNPLSDQAIRKITEKIFSQWQARLFSERGIRLRLSDAAMAFVVERGYSHLFGARELHRVIEQVIIGAVAGYLSDNLVEKGAAVVVDVDNGIIHVTKK